MPITNIKGDLFKLMPQTAPTKFICHIVNNSFKWGAGFVIPLAKHRPRCYDVYRTSVNLPLGDCQFVRTQEKGLNCEGVGEIIVVNMIAQNSVKGPQNPKPIKYEALIQCMRKVEIMARCSKTINDISTELHCPKFGSGLAGGNWSFIKELIEEIWGNLPVFIYEL